MDERILAALRLLPDYLGRHVLLSAAALALGCAIALPLAIVAARRPAVRWPAMAAASFVQTIPGLALLGVGVPALGFLPSLLALTLYSMLPILRNAVAGLTGVDAAVLEAADAVGMTPRQRLLRVEAPLAAPVVMAGIRTAAVWTIGAATLSTTVGYPSLGDLIFAGLQTQDWALVTTGCVAAAALALVADALLGLVERGIKVRRRGLVWAGAVLLLAGTAAALAPTLAPQRPVVTIGAKNFSEQY